MAADSSEDVEQLEAELRALETTIYNEELTKLPTTPEVQPYLFASLTRDDAPTDPNRASNSTRKNTRGTERGEFQSRRANVSLSRQTLLM